VMGFGTRHALRAPRPALERICPCERVREDERSMP
jgi:hypothetical protein